LTGAVLTGERLKKPLAEIASLENARFHLDIGIVRALCGGKSVNKMAINSSHEEMLSQVQRRVLDKADLAEQIDSNCLSGRKLGI